MTMHRHHQQHRDLGRCRRLPRSCILAASLLAIGLSGHATTYHVAPTGHNQNSGSEAAPWQSIQYALDQAHPGDTILVAAGIYPEAIQTVRDGHPDAPIALRARVPGTATLEGSSSDWSTGVRVRHDNILLEGFEIRDWSSTGIWIDGAAGFRLTDTLVHSLPFGVGAANGAHDFMLERVEIRNFDLYGFDASPSGGAACWNGTLIDCSAHSARDPEQNVDGFALGHGTQHGFRFVRCEAYDVFDGFDISADDTQLDSCRSYRNGNAGFKIWSDGVRLENCVAYGNGITNLELDWDGTPGRTTLRQCTLFEAAVYSIWIENSLDALDMANCIVAGGENIGLAFEQRDASRYTGDFNLFQNDNPARAIAVGYADEFGLDQVAAGAWTAYSGQDLNSIVVRDAAMIFSAPVQYELSLSSDSPALDAGSLAHATTHDITGTTRPQGPGPDLGAWEREQ